MTIVFGSTDDPGTPLDETVAPDREFLDGTGRFVDVETGLNKVDFWIGGLAENALASGGLLGSTFNFVFETQMENLQNGDRFYYLSRLEGTNFLTQLEGTSFSELVMRNTSATHLPFDVFSVPAHTIEVGDPATFPADADGNPLVSSTGPGMVQFLGTDAVVIGGTGQQDTIVAGGGDDTIWGDGGDDQLDGGAGDDAIIGGDGNDRIQGGDGDDFANGAAGDDRISGGEGSDLLVGLEGRDTVFGGGGDDEVFGGLGDDAIDGGAGDDVLLGNEGNDTLRGGEGDDHLIGNNGKSLIDAAPDTDVAVFSSHFASYTITQNPDGTVMVTDNVGTDGIDTLESIERLQFTDRTTLVDGTTAPQIASIQDNDTFVFRDDVMIQPDTGQLPDIVADAGNDVVPAEKLQVDVPTASAEAPPTIGIPVSNPDLLLL